MVNSLFADFLQTPLQPKSQSSGAHFGVVLVSLDGGITEAADLSRSLNTLHVYEIKVEDSASKKKCKCQPDYDVKVKKEPSRRSYCQCDSSPMQL